MKTHVIRRGETLSQLAKYYNTDVTTLHKLNSQQIKDIDLIFDGKTLILPDVIDTTSGERAEKQSLPNTQLVLTQCKNPEYVDALYVPEHPNTKKQMLILLTEDAKKYVLEDHQRCQQALEGDKATISTQLTKLGVMDQFNSITHEVFLKKISKTKATSYRKALLNRFALQKSYSNKELTFPNDDIEMGLSRVESRLSRIEKTYTDSIEDIENRANGILVPISHMSGEVMLKKDALAGTEALKVKQLRKLQKDIIEELDEIVDKFEKEAMEHASKTTVDENGHTYKFSKKHGFYSTNVELKINDAIETISKERESIGLNDTLDSKELKNGSKLLSLKEAFEGYSYWESRADPVLKKLNAQQIEWQPESFFGSHRENNIKYSSFFAALHRLNQSGAYIKEQCLTKGELFKEWETVDAIKEYIKQNSPSIDELTSRLEELNKQTPISTELGYYSAYVLNLALLQEIAIRIQNFNDLFGENQKYAHYVKQLFVYAEHAQQRCDALLKKASDQVATPILDYQKTSVTFVGDVPITDESSRSIIFNESQWKPKDLDGQIFVNSGVNERTIVECALSSQPDKLLYILSDSPVLSSDVSENKQCTSIVNLNLGTSVGRQKEQISAAIKQAFGGSSETVLGSLKYERAVDWGSLPEIIFPWSSEKYQNEILGITAMTETSGGAQFARFIYSASAKLDQDSFSQGPIKGEFTTDFVLASTEQKIKVRLPTSGEMQLDIPYRKRESEKRHIENVGSAVLEIEGKVYGVLAATLKLGTQIHIGNMESTSEEQDIGPLGIKGTVPNRSDYTQYNVKVNSNGGSTETALAAGFTGDAKAFAGVEAGGVLSCKLDWKKDQKTAKQNLFKVSSGFKVSVGIGYDGIFQCTFSRGRFVFITAVAATSGIGFGGKFATELNPQAADDFFAMLLAITEKSGFQRFEFFDESGEVSSFEAFNRVLTVAAAFGLTIGQVLMLPFNVINNMEEQATNKENAYFVANFLISKEHQKENQAWITSLTAEVLAKLLTVLVNYNPIPSIGWGEDLAERQNIAAYRNQNQRKAIIKILEWLGGPTASKTQINKFENAVQRMYLKKPTELDKTEQWRRYADNLLMIRGFFVTALSDEYQDPNNPRSDYMKGVIDDFQNFKELIDTLTKNTRVMERVQLGSGRRGRLSTTYVAVSSLDVENLQKEGFKLLNWLPEIRK